MMSMRDMSVVRGFLVIACLMVFGCFLMVAGCVLVMFSSFSMMFCCLFLRFRPPRIVILEYKTLPLRRRIPMDLPVP
jgi:hypothetical protein